MKYAPLHWCDLDIGGDTIPVYLSCSGLTESLEECIGVTEQTNDGIVIFIDAGQPRSVQDETLLHEFVHACLWGKRYLKLHWKKEESLAQEIACAGKHVFKWPRRPRGAKALEAYART